MRRQFLPEFLHHHFFVIRPVADVQFVHPTRQGEAKRGSSPHFALDPNPAAVRFDDAFDDRKPDSIPS